MERLEAAIIPAWFNAAMCQIPLAAGTYIDLAMLFKRKDSARGQYISLKTFWLTAMKKQQMY